MNYTAEEYQTAAKLIREHNGDVNQAAFFEQQAAHWIERRNKYAHGLGQCGRDDFNDLRGVKLLEKILDDGWTPPEGLL